MNEQDFKYHWDNLLELDPDQVVSDLNLTTEDIIAAFPHAARAFIEREFG